MEGIMQIAALAVTAVLCAAVIRRGAPEAALVLVLAAGYFCYAIGKLQTHCETLWEGTTSWL